MPNEAYQNGDWRIWSSRGIIDENTVSYYVGPIKSCQYERWIRANNLKSAIILVDTLAQHAAGG